MERRDVLLFLNAESGAMFLVESLILNNLIGVLNLSVSSTIMVESLSNRVGHVIS